MPGDFIFELAEGPRLIFSSPAGESTWHVALKLLAYLLYRRRTPLVERAVGQRYKPDLVVLRQERVRLWIDCGDTSLRKLDRVVTANSAARIVIVKDTLPHLESYCRLAASSVRDTRRIVFLAFSEGLVDGIAHELRQRNKVSFQCGPAGLQLVLNGVPYHGMLFRRTAHDLPAIAGRGRRSTHAS